VCGRITCRTSGEEFQREFDLAFAELLTPRFNLAPTQPVPAVLASSGPRALEHLRWGLIPGWAKDPRSGAKMINARAETLSQKPAFRKALESRRCVVLADGFYEWRRDGKERVPFHVQRRGARPFAMAGLWSEWVSPRGELVRSCTIITTAPTALLAPLHDRMPLILRRDEVDAWLSAAPLAEDAARRLLAPSRVDDLELRQVSARVNSVQNDDPGCLAPPEPSPAGELFDMKR